MPLTPKYDYASVGGPGVVPLQGDASGNNCGPITAANPMPVSMAGSTGTSSTTVQGTSASGVADDGANPLKVGGVYSSALPTLTNGQRGNNQLNARGGTLTELMDGNTGIIYTGRGATDGAAAYSVAMPMQAFPILFNGSTYDRMRGDTSGLFAQGNVASGVTDAGNPLKVGGVVNTTAPTAGTSGQRKDVWMGQYGQVMVGGNANTAADGQTNNLTYLLSNSGALSPLPSAGFVFNGTTWDRARGDTSGQYVAGVISSSAASGVTRAVTSAVASALVIKASAGNLGRVGITTGANAGYLMLFNATTAPADGAVTPVSAYTVAANSTLEMDYSGAALQFATGIVAVFSTTGPFTKTASATAMIWADAK